MVLNVTVLAFRSPEETRATPYKRRTITLLKLLHHLFTMSTVFPIFRRHEAFNHSRAPLMPFPSRLDRTAAYVGARPDARPLHEHLLCPGQLFHVHLL